MPKTVLVTGGAGYIGSHLCKALWESGYKPVVYDNLSNGHFETVRWGPIVVGDLRDGETLDETFRSHRPDAVIHMAGDIVAGESVADPAKYYRNNMEGLLGLLDAMRAHDVRDLVFSSSAAVYGTPSQAPVSETAPLQPTTPYGHTKAMAEQILADYAVYGLRTIALRYFNAAGADPDGDLGEMHEPETHLIPIVLEVAAGQQPTCRHQRHRSTRRPTAPAYGITYMSPTSRRRMSRRSGTCRPSPAPPPTTSATATGSVCVKSSRPPRRSRASASRPATATRAPATRRFSSPTPHAPAKRSAGARRTPISPNRSGMPGPSPGDGGENCRPPADARHGRSRPSHKREASGGGSL